MIRTLEFVKRRICSRIPQRFITGLADSAALRAIVQHVAAQVDTD